MNGNTKPLAELSANTIRRYRYRARHLYCYLMFQHSQSDPMKAYHEMWALEARLGIKAKDIRAYARRIR